MNVSEEKKEVVKELHRPARKNFKRRKVIMKGIDDTFQIDLVEMIPYAKENKGYKYMLTVIDTFSKYAWAEPVKTKSANDVTKAFLNVLNKDKRIPKNVQSDNGKEFYNATFKKLMQKYNINHYSTYSHLKASIVERFNRTLKNIMWRKFSLQGSYKWIDILPHLINQYNNTKHRTIKMRPKDVRKKHETYLLNSVYRNVKVASGRTKYKAGDSVRISKTKGVFNKGYHPSWSTEIFTIKKIQFTDPVTYKLQDYLGHDIEGGFYEEELQKTKFPNVYLVEKVLKRKGSKVYVKWLGFNNSHNTWINNSDVIN